jgi:peptidoglycan hydrolase-like protein with peptidoglycan-binding domain
MAIRTRRRKINTATESKTDQVADRYPFRHPLDTGDRGALVLWAQSKLTEHGHYSGPLDGRYNRDVVLSVRKFQESQHLAITGIIDRKTWNALQPSQS